MSRPRAPLTTHSITVGRGGAHLVHYTRPAVPQFPQTVRLRQRLGTVVPQDL